MNFWIFFYRTIKFWKFDVSTKVPLWGSQNQATYFLKESTSWNRWGRNMGIPIHILFRRLFIYRSPVFRLDCKTSEWQFLTVTLTDHVHVWFVVIVWFIFSFNFHVTVEAFYLIFIMTIEKECPCSETSELTDNSTEQYIDTSIFGKSLSLDFCYLCEVTVNGYSSVLDNYLFYFFRVQITIVRLNRMRNWP